MYIVHGYSASPADHWFQWLQNKLASDSIGADILKMPNPSKPVLADWTQEISLNVRDIHKGTYIVAHSLGCAAVLRFLEKLDPSGQAGGIILVSGFTKPLPSLPILDEFTREPFDFDKIKAAVAGTPIVVASKNDEIIPVEFSKELARNIDADFHELDQGGHFLGSDGFTTFPLVYELLTRK